MPDVNFVKLLPSGEFQVGELADGTPILCGGVFNGYNPNFAQGKTLGSPASPPTPRLMRTECKECTLLRWVPADTQTCSECTSYQMQVHSCAP